MSTYVLGLEEIDRNRIALVGGKAAALGELSRIEGISVPEGFCVTTDAYRLVQAQAPSFSEIPDGVAMAIAGQIDQRGEGKSWAVRSSATAEDLPDASFAGQHDSYLNLLGTSAVLEHVRRCWASLFNPGAVSYRRQHGIGERDLAMAVVIQEMVEPDAAGVLFTADPLTSNRKVASVEAVRGLGEALVSGKANPDTYKVRAGDLTDKSIAAEHHGQPVLSDRRVSELIELGRKIESHLGGPQDIEWCLGADGQFKFVQSRPITTLFPLPEAGDCEPHVYVSVGHQQMMTDAMKPLGLSFWGLTTPRPMREAAGRLFVDVAPLIASPAAREQIIGALGHSDPLIGDALETVVESGFVPEAGDEAEPSGPPAVAPTGSDPPEPVAADPSITAGLIERHEESLVKLEREIRDQAGAGLLAFIRTDLDSLRSNLFDPRSMEVINATMEATRWVNEWMEEWLGESNAADRLTRSAPGNVSAEMGLALLDVADQIRPHLEVVALLEEAGTEDDGFLDRLAGLEGGPKAEWAIRAYLERFGMRCVGEIDITRPRWSEHPAALIPMILQHVHNAEPGAAERRFERGRLEADAWERDLLERVRALPGGEAKSAEAGRKIDLVRTFTGYREYPKYGMVSRYFIYKQALMKEAGRLAQRGVLEAPEDIFYLRFGELEEAVRSGRADADVIRRRRAEFRSFEPLVPPRVMTSDGETLSGEYRRDDLAPGALAGLAVSAGTVEGRARVIEDPAGADVEPGDILVTAFTDPSWAPVFVGIAGLVTEVGGLMTHGAVVAREYGLPAVVGVKNATGLIGDGQMIRIDGTSGFVSPLPPDSKSRG